MYKIVLSLIVLLCLVGCSKGQTQFVEPIGDPRPSINPMETNTSFESEEWYDRYDIFEVNRELAHASFTSYRSIDEALVSEKSSLDKIDMYSSPYVQSLNGTWGFYYAQKPSERLKNIAGFDAFTYWENWDESLLEPIEVPSNIQTIRSEDGLFKYENPIYINQIYPWLNYEEIQYGWQGEPLAPTSINSVGHYKREFELDEALKGRNIFLSFKGVESAFYVYINGQRVGYSEDSYTTSDFNITPYLKEGKNTLAVEVYRWSTGSYFENQDFIRLSGIFRDVLLYSKDDVEIRDYFVTTDINDDYTNATIKTEIAIRNLSDKEKDNYSILVDVYDQHEDISVIDKPIIQIINILKPYENIKDDGEIFEETIQIENPKLWSSEKPNLYRLVIQLLDEFGKPIETVCSRIGIREVEVKEISGKSQIIVNGKPIMLKGVNRHESSLMNGRAITSDEIKQDLEIMKSFNINSFRTSHYPNQEITYDMADELGLYVMDEANIESHIGEKELGVPGNNPIYIPLIMDRTMSMVERDKNHASILFWSLGNEATYKEYPMDENYPFYVSSMWVLKRDPSRLRVYERDNRIGKTREESMVDVVSSQYWTLDQINEYGKKEKNAFFQSEYGHGMGNALGNFKEYYDSFRKYDNIQGGFIWDFIDQSIFTTDINGNEFYGNGNDWGTLLHDGDFSGNGLVSANRSPQAEIEEVKKVQQDFQLSYKDNTLTIVSECIDTNLNEFDVTIELKHDGKSIHKSKLSDEDSNLEPLGTKKIKLKLPDLTSYSGEIVMNVFVTYQQDQTWANEYGGKLGDTYSYEQFILQDASYSIDIQSSNQLDANESDNTIIVSNDSFELTFNKTKGIIENYSIEGNEIFVNGPRVSFYRAPVSNDIQFSDNVKNADTSFVPSNVSLSSKGEQVIIDCKGIIESTDSTVSTIYTINGNGEVLVESILDVPSIKSVGEIARVGYVFDLSNEMNSYKMYGRGPHENYVDRNSASLIDIYLGKMDDLFNDTYLTPQDSGNKTDVRWIEVNNDDTGIIIKSDQEFGVNILPYSDQDVAETKHYYELAGKEKRTMHLDVAQRGLGNGSWGAEPLDKYKIKQDKKMTMKFLISPK